MTSSEQERLTRGEIEITISVDRDHPLVHKKDLQQAVGPESGARKQRLIRKNRSGRRWGRHNDPANRSPILAYNNAMKKRLLFLVPFVLSACILTDAPASVSPPAPTEPAATRTGAPATQPPPADGQTPTPTVFSLPVFTPFPPADQGTLVMDGFLDDWAAFEPLFIDAQGDAGPSGIDFTAIYAAHTDTHLLLRVDLGKTVNLQSEPALYMVLQLGDTEIRYDFGARRGRLNGDSVRQDEIGLISLPTVTSDIFEISVPYEGRPDPAGILFFDPSDDGDVATPDGDLVPYGWQNYVSSAAARSLDRPEGALRIVSWNVLQDNIFDKNLGPHFERVLQALEPDVILIQEIYIYSEKTALNRVNEWLGGEWYAKQQGDLITISRYPFIEDWREGNHNLRARIFPTMIDVDGTPLVIFNAHLSCCDRDQDRQDEVDSFIGFLREVGLPEGTPFFLGGDLNLVGDAQQLATLLTGNIIDEEKFGADFNPDWDGTALADLVPGHTHTNFSYTWKDDESSFAPGRLDFMIYTDSVLNVRGFVVDTTELPGNVLDAYGLLAEDTRAASDHLPIVADVVIGSAP